MQIGLIGLGKMGYPLAQNLHESHEVIAYDKDNSITGKLKQEGISVAGSIQELVTALEKPRVIWIMVPAGQIVDSVLELLLPSLDPGDIIIDGGNSQYQTSVNRAVLASDYQVEYLDCGTSGGVDGARHGICAMVGGKADVFAYCEPLFRSISLPGGYLYCGPSGSGHFVKMVHNGIEYGMMQAMAEGFSMLRNGGYQLDLPAVAELWNQGSVIRGWLMELGAKALQKDPGLDGIKGVAHASGEAQWMVEDAMNKKISIPVTALSLLMRFQSQDAENFSAKMVAALRNEFGGHAVEKK